MLSTSKKEAANWAASIVFQAVRMMMFDG